MSAKTLLVLSIAANIALACSVMFLTNAFSSLPEATTALVIYRSTNLPPQLADENPLIVPKKQP